MYTPGTSILSLSNFDCCFVNFAWLMLIIARVFFLTFEFNLNLSSPVTRRQTLEHCHLYIDLSWNGTSLIWQVEDMPLEFAVGALTTLPLTTPSGIPQSSSVGFVLFAIFLNDFVRTLNYRSCYSTPMMPRSINLPFNCSMLQRDLDSFIEWSITNCLPLSIEKYYIISFSQSPSKTVFDYTIQRKAFVPCFIG